MTAMADSPPIVCTLDSGDFRERARWIADLNARALRAVRRRDLCLELDYAPSALADIRQMVAQEQSCCGFLTFDITEQPDSVMLAIAAPEAARDAAEQVFHPFQQKTPQATSCGCGSSRTPD